MIPLCFSQQSNGLYCDFVRDTFLISLLPLATVAATAVDGVAATSAPHPMRSAGDPAACRVAIETTWKFT